MFTRLKVAWIRKMARTRLQRHCPIGDRRYSSRLLGCIRAVQPRAVQDQSGFGQAEKVGSDPRRQAGGMSVLN